MQKLVELNKDETILVSSQIESFLQPDHVYLPIFDHDRLLVHKNDIVSVGQPLIKRGDAFVFSPVSGILRRACPMHSYREAAYYLEIENDFQERRYQEQAGKKKISKKDLEPFFSLLEGKKNFVLSAIDDEVYVLTENFYLFYHYEGFLELLASIKEQYSLEAIYVCVKASSSESIHKLMMDLGMYPEIILKVVPDYYLLGKPSFLLSYLNLDREETLVMEASSFYHIYNELKRGRSMSDVYLTVSGNTVVKPKVLQVKIGSMLSDILALLIDLKEEDVVYLANGLMAGREIEPKCFVVTPDLQSILIMKRKDKKKTSSCIHCGACHDICPVGLHPLYFSNPEYIEQVKDQCLKCGLCSYICPVYQSFRRDEDE